MLVSFECINQAFSRRRRERSRAAEATRVYQTPWREATRVTTSNTQPRSVTTGTRAGRSWWSATPLVVAPRIPARTLRAGTSRIASRGSGPCGAEGAQGETNDFPEDVEATGSQGRTEVSYYEFLQPPWMLAVRERLGWPTHPDPLRSNPSLDELEEVEEEQPWWEDPTAYNSRDGSIQVSGETAENVTPREASRRGSPLSRG